MVGAQASLRPIDLYILNQGDLGGAAHKPTALGTNMEVSLPEHKVQG